MAMKAFRWRVAPGGSVMDPHSRVLRAGQVIDNDSVTEKWLEDAKRDGYIQEAGINPGFIDAPVPDVPGVTPSPLLNPNNLVDENTRRPHLSIGQDTNPNAAAVRIATANAVQQTTTPPNNPAPGADALGQIPSGQPQAPAVAPVAPAQVAAGKWNLNPKDLNEKSLKQLNQLAAERQPGIAEFRDKREAVAFMSQDFNRR